jgi:hypothetical protein
VCGCVVTSFRSVIEMARIGENFDRAAIDAANVWDRNCMIADKRAALWVRGGGKLKCELPSVTGKTARVAHKPVRTGSAKITRSTSGRKVVCMSASASVRDAFSAKCTALGLSTVNSICVDSVASVDSSSPNSSLEVCPRFNQARYYVCAVHDPDKLIAAHYDFTGSDSDKVVLAQFVTGNFFVRSQERSVCMSHDAPGTSVRVKKVNWRELTETRKRAAREKVAGDQLYRLNESIAACASLVSELMAQVAEYRGMAGDDAAQACELISSQLSLQAQKLDCLKLERLAVLGQTNGAYQDQFRDQIASDLKARNKRKNARRDPATVAASRAKSNDKRRAEYDPAARAAAYAKASAEARALEADIKAKRESLEIDAPVKPQDFSE